MPTQRANVIDVDPEYGPAPRALRYAEKANAAEQLIVDALDGIIRKLISQANDGNVAASRYLLDRIYGRPARLSIPAIADRELAFTPRDWGKAKYVETKKHEAFRRDYFRPAHPFEDDNFPGIAPVSDPLLRIIRGKQGSNPRT